MYLVIKEQSNYIFNQGKIYENSQDMILLLRCVAEIPRRSPSRYAGVRSSVGPLGRGESPAQPPALIKLS